MCLSFADGGIALVSSEWSFAGSKYSDYTVYESYFDDSISISSGGLDRVPVTGKSAMGVAPSIQPSLLPKSRAISLLSILLNVFILIMDSN